MDGEEELAGPSRLSPLTKWLAGGVALAAVAIIAVQLSDGAGFGAVRAAHPEPSARTEPKAAEWPRADGSCGSGLLPIVSSVPITPEATGIRVLLGGDQLRQVDIDTGTSTIVRGVEPQAGQSITQLRGSAPTYAVLSGCDPLHDPELIRLGADAPGPVATTGLLRNVISVAGQAWAVVGGLSSTTPGMLRSLDGSTNVPTPRGFTPLGVIGVHYVGEQMQPGPLFGEDPPTVQVRDLRDADSASTRLGRGQVIAVTPTGVLWLTPCPGGVRTACTLVYQSLAPSGPPKSFHLPPGRVPTARGVVSPDGKQVAFTLQRDAPDTRYPSDAAPTDVAVLATSSGSLTIVPGVELPTAPVPGLAFSDTGWLILALNNGPTTRLLAWRPGLGRPLESPAVPAVANGRPPVVILPNRDS